MPKQETVIEPTKKKGDATDALRGYLEAWKASDWVEMNRHVQLTRRVRDCPEQLELSFGFQVPASFEILQVVQKSNVLAEGQVSVVFKGGDGIMVPQKWWLNVICESAPYTPDEFGTWGVNPKTFRKNQIPHGQPIIE